MIDTGTTFISVPKSDAESLHRQIPGAVKLRGQDNFDSYAYPCNTTAQNMPALVIGKQSLAIDPLDFNVGPVDASQEAGIGNGQAMCRSFFFGGRMGNRFLVGTPFLRTWYTVFQWGEEPVGKEIGKGAGVSFAKAVH